MRTATRRLVLQRPFATATGLVAGLAVACGAPGQQAGQGTSAGASKAPVALEYWTFWAEDRVSVLRPELPKLAQRLPYLTVNILSDAAFRDKLRAAVTAGTPPDTSISEVFSAALLFDNGTILD